FGRNLSRKQHHGPSTGAKAASTTPCILLSRSTNDGVLPYTTASNPISELNSRGCIHAAPRDASSNETDVDSSMTITADIFEAFLKCPTKCYLRSLGELGTGNAYADWLSFQNESCRREGVKCLTAGTAPSEHVGGPSATTNLKLAKWQFAIDY